MKTKMTLWGIGPKFALSSFAFTIIIMSIHYFTKPLFDIDVVPQTIVFYTGVLFLIIGVPFFLLSAITISKVYAQNSLCTSGVYSTCRHPLWQPLKINFLNVSFCIRFFKLVELSLTAIRQSVNP